jgi:anaerobic ribonucleoside-triphosphate reductase activating protein
MTEIAISRVHYPVTTLGPGRRIGIWMQGCSIRCQGCISADTWGTGRGRIALSELLSQLAPWLTSAHGITISGGEPFDQPEALAGLLQALRSFDPTKDTLVYSGYPRETLETHLKGMRDLIDALISDPYDEAASQTKALRGSDNQRLYWLTPLGFARFGGLVDAPAPVAALDVMFDDDGGVWFAGVPRRDKWQALQRALEATSFETRTTQDVSHRGASGQP